MNEHVARKLGYKLLTLASKVKGGKHHIVLNSKLSLIGILVTNANFSERLRGTGKADCGMRSPQARGRGARKPRPLVNPAPSCLGERVLGSVPLLGVRS